MSVIYTPRGMAREYSPLACNLYAGCEHGCTYCYAPSAVRRTPADFHGNVTPRANIIENLRKDARKFAGTRDRVLLCFTCDPYQPREEQHGITREALRILAAHDIPVQILTKGGLLAARDFDLLARMDGVFATTLGFTNDRHRRQYEPNAASVSSRLSALAQAHALGIPTWVSIEPAIMPDQALDLIRHYGDCVDEWRVGKWNHDAAANAINWSVFAQQALAALQASGKRWLIKDALAAYLPVGAPTRSVDQGRTDQAAKGLFGWSSEIGRRETTAITA